jgi:hypothetical protein
MSEEIKNEEQSDDGFVAGFDLNNPKSIENKITELTHDLMAGSFDIMERMKKGREVTSAEKVYQEEGMRQLKFLTDLYGRIKKIGIVSSAKSSEEFDNDFFIRLKNKKGTIGNIVVDDTTGKKDNDEEDNEPKGKEKK